MAGFRNGRGRDNRTSRQQPQAQQRQQPQPYPGRQTPQPYGQQQWPPAGQAGRPGGYPPGQGGYGHPQGQGGHSDEPEYFGEPGPYQGQGAAPGGQGGPYQRHGGPVPSGIPSADPYVNDNNAGHTQAFSVNDDRYGAGATYHAGAAPVPTGPRLRWKDLLTGIVMRPAQTFLQMRDYPVWGPALTVTFLYGAVALFGFDQARDDVIHATLSTAIPFVLITAVSFLIGGLILGAVTHTVARQLGGDGSWQPTVGLSMLIMSITDAPRLLFAAFLGGDNGFVQILGWLTWLAAGFLLTSMVGKSHDLPWPKALGASAIQLIALLSLLKLGTL